jgi:MFS superfamily sulfate permease-like transporter
MSGLLVFLLALPLSLGIAMASGFPPVAGVLTAIVGGVVATWFGSAPLVIKGPAAGLIVVALGAVTELGGGDASLGYRKALAVGVAAAAIQIALALLRAGALGDFFPSAVVHGMLAAIGILIFSKQAHVLLGVTPHGHEPLQLLTEVPASLLRANPEIAIIGALSLAILVVHPRLRGRLSVIRKVPAPLLVVLVAMPLAVGFDLDHAHTYTVEVLHHSYAIGPEFLVNLPGNLIAALAWPDFSALAMPVAWKYVTMFALVGSIESLLSAKAVEGLDPWHRRYDLDRDLLATGVGNLVAALIGGLPMISEMVRSSANVTYGARTRLANFYHGVFLLIFVAFLPGLIHRIPLAALAAILIVTGARLASPGELVAAWRIGADQAVVFVATVVVTVATDLLIGVAAGIAVKIALHVIRGAPLRSILRAHLDVRRHGPRATIRVVHSAVFSNFLAMRRALERLPPEVTEVSVDVGGAALVDHTVLHRLHDIQREWARTGRHLAVVGLDALRARSAHPLAVRTAYKGRPADA